MNKKAAQLFVKTVRDSKGQLVYFNYGIDLNANLKNTCTSLSDEEYVCTTVYAQGQYSDYYDHVTTCKEDLSAQFSPII